MKVINPFNRIPEADETLVKSGCHCVCYSGSQGTYNLAWLPIVPNCQCNCHSGSTANKDANYSIAYNA